MKIVYLLGTAGGAWGGLERHTLDLAKALADEHDVYVIADEKYRRFIALNVKFCPCEVSRSRYSPLLWRQLRLLLQHLQPDVVHAQGGKAAKILGWHHKYLRAHGSVTVGSVHGTKSNHKAYAGLDGVIAVSENIAAKIKHVNCRVILNGIEPYEPPLELVEACRNQRQQWSGTLALAIGRLSPVKGFDLLLKAWPLETDAHLVILGEGSERVRLERLCRDLGLQTKVTFLGHSLAVAAWLRVADVVIISSRSEGFPYVLVEALQSSCPVLSTEVSGVKALLAPEHLVAVEDVSGLRALLRKQLPAHAALRAIQRPLFSRAKKELTLQAMKSATLNFYLFCQNRRANA